MEPDATGPCERLWRRHFAAFADPELREARLIFAEGETPTLAYPVHYDATRREEAFGWALPALFLRQYGERMLDRALQNFELVVVAAMTPPRRQDDHAAAAD